MLILLGLANCTRQPKHQAQGYIEGRYTYMASSVSGALEQLLVERGQRVKQGQVLYRLESQPESDAYQAAAENLKEVIAARNVISANLHYAEVTYKRYMELVPKGAIERSQLDNAKSTYTATLAQLAQANANIAETTAVVAQAKWRLDQKSSLAPQDGIVFDTYYRPGELTETGKPILSLLAYADIKVIFFVNERILGQLRLGDVVNVTCDGCKKIHKGKISFISPSAEYTPPVIYSTETNEKLIYRIEAAFARDDAKNLHPGQPVYVNYAKQTT